MNTPIDALGLLLKNARENQLVVILNLGDNYGTQESVFKIYSGDESSAIIGTEKEIRNKLTLELNKAG
jgi:hypothetical protein